MTEKAESGQWSLDRDRGPKKLRFAHAAGETSSSISHPSTRRRYRSRITACRTSSSDSTLLPTPASTALKWFLEDEDGRVNSLAILHTITDDHRPSVPNLWYSEIANTFLVQVRRERSEFGQAIEFLNVIDALLIDVDPPASSAILRLTNLAHSPRKSQDQHKLGRAPVHLAWIQLDWTIYRNKSGLRGGRQEIHRPRMARRGECQTGQRQRRTGRAFRR